MCKILWRTISDLFTRGEVHLELLGVFQTSKMRVLHQNSLRLKAFNYFRKKAPSYMFDWVWNTPLNSFINDAYESY